MRTTADKFKRNTHETYEAALKEEVIIKHDRHRRVDFVLTSRPRMSGPIIQNTGLINEQGQRATTNKQDQI